MPAKTRGQARIPYVVFWPTPLSFEMRAAYLKACRRVRDAVFKFNRRTRTAGRPVLPVFILEVPDVPLSVPRPAVLPTQKDAAEIDDLWVHSWPVEL